MFFLMADMFLELFYPSLIGSLLVLDTTAVLQVLISQPIVSGAILGWFLGDVSQGLHIGLLLQLLWLNQMPVGAAKVPEGNLASVIGVILFFRLVHLEANYHNILILLVVLYALLISYLGVNLITILRNWNVKLLSVAVEALEKGRPHVLGRVSIIALGIHFLMLVVVIISSVFLGQLIFENTIPLLHTEWDIFARYTELALIGSGIGLTVSLYKEKRGLIYVFAGILLGILLVFVI